MSKHEAGLITIIDPGADKPIAEIMTVQCVHCSGHFPEPRFDSSPEAKALRVGRGSCTRCCGYICGAGCAKCVPTEQYLENIEQGRPEDYVPVKVSLYLPTSGWPLKSGD